jgi:hypothetical protein
MTNLTMITADEEVGMALTILIQAQSKKGQDIFSNCTVLLNELDEPLDDNDSTKSNSNNTRIEQNTLSDYLKKFEILLSFHSRY